MSIDARLGEEQGGRAAVDELYERVLADPQLAGYCGGVDVRRLRGRQTALLVQVTGGPAGYNAHDVAAAQDRTEIAAHDVDRVVELLAGTLADLDTGKLDVGKEDIAEVGAALTAHRSEIVAVRSAAH